VEVVVVEVIEN